MPALDDFCLSDGTLTRISVKFKQELCWSIEDGNKRMLRCLPTFVKEGPTGEEQGEFALIDLGGTNLRVGIGKLKGNQKYELQVKETLIPDNIKEGSGQQLIDFISENLLDFTANLEWERIDVGFTFSFPVSQKALNHAEIIQFNKGFNCSDIIGKDVVQLLQERLPSKYRVCSLVNDTVGTLMAHAYKNPATKMSCILGTGTNAAYWDMVDGKMMVINIEWGAYGDGHHELLPFTRYDDELDGQSENVGKQRFEKMVSGMYLGELFRLASKGKLKCQYELPYSIDSSMLPDVSGLLKDPGDLGDLQVLANMIMERSAKLAASLIAGVYFKSRQQLSLEDDFVVSIDGSLYTKNAKYQTVMQETIERIVGPESRIVFETSDGEPLIGSAIAAAANHAVN